MHGNGFGVIHTCSLTKWDRPCEFAVPMTIQRRVATQLVTMVTHIRHVTTTGVGTLGRDFSRVRYIARIRTGDCWKTILNWVD